MYMCKETRLLTHARVQIHKQIDRCKEERTGRRTEIFYSEIYRPHKNIDIYKLTNTEIVRTDREIQTEKKRIMSS